jgi:hypothetical protein
VCIHIFIILLGSRYFNQFAPASTSDAPPPLGSDASATSGQQAAAPPPFVPAVPSVQHYYGFMPQMPVDGNWLACFLGFEFFYTFLSLQTQRVM